MAERRWSLDELDHLADEEVVVTLDCTGGWYAHQRWAEVPLDRLLAASGVSLGRSIEVQAVTGYRRRFPWRDAPVLLLATRVGGRPLSSGHGFPRSAGRSKPAWLLVGEVGERDQGRPAALVVAVALPAFVIRRARELTDHVAFRDRLPACYEGPFRTTKRSHSLESLALSRRRVREAGHPSSDRRQKPGHVRRGVEAGRCDDAPAPEAAPEQDQRQNAGTGDLPPPEA